MCITSCDYYSREHANLKCSKCKCVYYCSQDCQKKDWKEHKEVCNALAGESIAFQTKESEMTAYLDNLVNATKRECAICLESCIKKPLPLPCQHVFCEHCLFEQQMHQNSAFLCPLCRKELSSGLYSYILQNASFFILQADYCDQKERCYAHARR